MLRALEPKSTICHYNGYVPALVEPLVHATISGDDLLHEVCRFTRHLGFDTFMSGVSLSLQPSRETLAYVFTTMPTEWVTMYDQRSYVEIDPRIQSLLKTPLPIVWDQSTFRGRSKAIDAFLDAGLEYGLGSGIAVGFVDTKGHGSVCALNSKTEFIDAQRKTEIFSNVSDILLFAHFFHELFIAGVIREGTPPRSRGAPLSPRERECITLAAHGLTSDDIGQRLGIVERTVQFHFDSIRSKLAAATRQEAIAKAVQAGIVTDIL